MGDPALRTPAALLLLTVLAALPGLAAASEPGATVILRRPGEAGAAAVEPAADPYAWLEEIDGERAMEWVRRQNARTAEHLKAQPRFDELYRQALAALDSETRIPQVTQRGKWLYDFWKDEQHPRGIYRRTTLEQLRREEPEWQVVLDVDALAAAEGKPWVFKGTSCLPPAYRRCLVDLSPGGGDAVEVRELDAETLQLVPGGFFLPTAKTAASWVDEDTLFVATDFGEGSLTTSGYPRILKRWRRGTPLAAATTVYEVEPTATSVFGARLRADEGDVDLVVAAQTVWEFAYLQLLDGRLHRLELPATAVVADNFRGRLVVSLKEDWQRAGGTLRAGWVVIADPAALRGGEGRVEVVVEPQDGEVVQSLGVSEQGVLVSMLDAVRGRLYRYEPAAGGGWTRRAVPFPDNGALRVITVDDDNGDFFVVFQSFTVPPTLYRVPAATLAPQAVKAQEPTFDGSRFAVSQHWAPSADGTRVPYFMVASRDLELDGANPTHIFSYGGFRNALTPSYSGSYEPLYGAYGKLWLERGGVFVLANIRGGGELGPEWHTAALKENRHKAFEDFEAVAADLAARKVTSPGHLGIEGRSNGGLLVFASMIRRPELYGAVIAGVPLTDMRRYHQLLAGASWMAEFGDPDVPQEWAYIQTYSPYHTVERGRDYPPVFVYTSTRDDRVHPGHARKMVAKLQALGHQVWYYENTEGGHGGSVTNEQMAYRLALAYAHLWNELLGPAAAAPSPPPR